MPCWMALRQRRWRCGAAGIGRSLTQLVPLTTNYTEVVFFVIEQAESADWIDSPHRRPQAQQSDQQTRGSTARPLSRRWVR